MSKRLGLFGRPTSSELAMAIYCQNRLREFIEEQERRITEAYGRRGRHGAAPDLQPSEAKGNK